MKEGECIARSRTSLSRFIDLYCISTQFVVLSVADKMCLIVMLVLSVDLLLVIS